MKNGWNCFPAVNLADDGRALHCHGSVMPDAAGGVSEDGLQLLSYDCSADCTGEATIPFRSQAYAAPTDEDFPDFLYDFYMSYCIDP